MGMQITVKDKNDAVKAEDILDKAGWVIGGDGIREKDGKKAGFTLMYPAGDSVRQALAADTANRMRMTPYHGIITGA